MRKDNDYESSSDGEESLTDSHTNDSLTLGEAYTAVTQARANHARALLALQRDPADAQAKKQLAAAIQSGRTAWRRYREVATAGLAAQISAILPPAFRDDG